MRESNRDAGCTFTWQPGENLSEMLISGLIGFFWPPLWKKRESRAKWRRFDPLAAWWYMTGTADLTFKWKKKLGWAGNWSWTLLHCIIDYFTLCFRSGYTTELSKKKEKRRINGLVIRLFLAFLACQKNQTQWLIFLAVRTALIVLECYHLSQ